MAQYKKIKNRKRTENHMRHIDQIQENIETLARTRNLEKDYEATIIFKSLFVEYLQALGFTVHETLCSRCGLELNSTSEDRRNWEFRYGSEKMPQIVYTCPHCKIEVSMKVTAPTADSTRN